MTDLIGRFARANHGYHDPAFQLPLPVQQVTFPLVCHLHIYYKEYPVMSTLRKRYQTRITRGLLLAGYLFLFAGQFNGHYFGIVNFFVFEQNDPGAGLPKAVAGTSLSLYDNCRRPAHLAIDKRYQPNQGLHVQPIHAPRPPYNTFIQSSFPVDISVYSSIQLPTNALRGPPCD